jgi:hypothetical protein|tara:strand:- start:2899 stop:3105 length:207 start_codon:yes stop_codon:yes gene_type:complete
MDLINAREAAAAKKTKRGGRTSPKGPLNMDTKNTFGGDSSIYSASSPAMKAMKRFRTLKKAPIKKKTP